MTPPLRRLAFFALFAAALAAPAAAQETQRIAGTIVALDEGGATMKPDAGEPVAVAFAGNLAVARLDRGSTADLKPGLFVGVGARPQADGTQKAVQIVIFPESMRGVGEGHRAWGVLPEATMTNGAIAETVQAVDGPAFTISYKGGTQRVTTPAEASILVLKLAERSDLKVGARGQAVAAKGADGRLTTSRITVWGEGVTPY